MPADVNDELNWSSPAPPTPLLATVVWLVPSLLIRYRRVSESPPSVNTQS